MFQEFPKIARLSRNCTITEKIDGTNAQVYIADVHVPEWDSTQGAPWIAEVDNLLIAAGSRNRYITPEADNFGFAAWVKANARELSRLGIGRHFGEWWGSGIQRGYGLPKGEKRWSLFNTGRWAPVWCAEAFVAGTTVQPAPECCHVVPVLYEGLFSTFEVNGVLEDLAEKGSAAAPGFMQPEGVVIYHTAAGVMFKKTILKDEAPKGKA